MIVSNVIAVSFFVITGTMFVVCTALANKQHPELKRREIGDKHHGDNGSDVLLHALSDFGVVRRSLNPVLLFEQYSSIRYPKGEPYVSNVGNRNRNIIEKLKSSVTFRDNVLYIFSYLLHGRENGLTEEQYTPLQMLYEFLKKKTVYMYNLLPILPKLKTMDKNKQTNIILMSLIKNLPPYFQCTARFLANEIRGKRIDLNVLLRPSASETFNYLANIDSDMISRSKVRIAGDEMRGHDKYSNITQRALGPVFVKLLRNLHANKLPLSQELFGLILTNLPNPNDDPVLEENIRYLYDLTKNNGIDRRNWDAIGKDPVGKDAYTLVFSILFRILSSNVRMVVKDAAVYVYHHLKLVMVPIQANPNFMYMYSLIKQDIDIGMLLSAITPQEFGPDAVRIKDRLLTYFMHNYRDEDMDKILRGFNKFAYRDPLNLLMAFLTRLVSRIPTFPNSDLYLLQQSAAALLPALIVRKYVRTFTPFVSPEVDVLILLESLKTPDLDPLLRTTIDAIKLELIAQPQISVLLSTLMPTEKNKCLMPRQCLMNTFQQVQRLQGNIPMTLNARIQNVAYILRTTLTMHQPQYQPQNFFTQYSMQPMDVNLYNVDWKNPAAAPIETDNAYTHNVPIELNGSPYVWNIDNYVSKTGPAVQIGSSGTPKRETGIAISIEATESKVIPSTATIDQTQVTEYSREGTSDQPLTLNSSLTTTSTSYISSQITYKPTREPQEEQLHQTTYTTAESSVKETDSEVEYSRTRETVSREKEISHRPTASEKIENQTYSPEEVDREVTTARSTQVTKMTHKRAKLPRKVEGSTTSAESVSTAVVLPPAIELDRPLTIRLSDSDVPIVTTDDDYNTTAPGLVLPEIKVLLKSPNVNDLLGDSDTPIVTQVLQPLSVIFGRNYVKKILNDVDVRLYSTNVALLSAVLKKATTYPQVAKNTNLMNAIRKYIATIEYVSPTILLPVVASSKKLVSNVVYVTYNSHDLTHSGISENPPDETSTDTVTVPLINPKIWLQSINPSDPYADLLPTLEQGDSFAITIQPLKTILRSERIVEILGPNFQPLVYPNKGALLITLLHKLQKAKTIQMNAELKYLIDMYINAIEIPSMNVQVSEDNFVKMMSETTGHWQPELTSLISALPIANNDVEVAMIEHIENFLNDPALLEKLYIAKPPLTMSRGDLLSKIILSALSSKIQLEKQILRALRYYKDKVEFNDMGALPIMWIWVEVYVVKAEVNLGNMIQETVDFNELEYKEKLAYNDLVTYLSQNPNILLNNEDFEFQKYKTQGQFVKDLFKHLLKKLQINNRIKKNIQMLLPRVMLTGPGVKAMPSFSGF